MKTSLIVAASLISLSPLHAQTLENKLLQKQNEFNEKASAEKKRAYEEGIQAVAKSGILKSAIQVGQKAPDFTLKNAKGQQVTLTKLLESGPVVITWYRGGWCPYCNITLAAMQEKLPEIKEAGAQLVALTPEKPDKSLTTQEKNHLGFEVLTDLNHQVARRYGIAFDLTPQVEAFYKENFDLTEFNGKEAGTKTLPLAATYIIGTDGMVRFAFLDADYRKRVEPQAIVDFLKMGNTDHKTESK